MGQKFSLIDAETLARLERKLDLIHADLRGSKVIPAPEWCGRVERFGRTPYGDVPKLRRFAALRRCICGELAEGSRRDIAYVPIVRCTARKRLERVPR